MTAVDTTAGASAVGRVLRNSGWLVGAYVLAFGFTFIQNVVLARNLDPSGFGVLAVVISLVMCVQLLLGSRVWEAVTKFVVEYLERGDPNRATATVKLCVLVDAVGAVVGTLFLLVVAKPAAQIFATPSAAGAIRLYALSILISIPVATAQALLRVADRFRWLAAQTVVENLVRLALVVLVLGLAGSELVPIIGAYLVAAMVSAGSLWALASRSTRSLGVAPWRAAPLSLLREDRGRILRFLLYSNLSGTARLVTSRVDILIVGWLTDPASVGVYRLARTVADPLAAVATPVSHALFPELSRLVQRRNVTAVRRLTRRIRNGGLAVVVPICFLVTLLAGWVVPLVFGESFAGAVPLTRIMVWQLVWMPFVWVPGLLLSLGRARLVAAMAAARCRLLSVPAPGTGSAVRRRRSRVGHRAPLCRLDRDGGGGRRQDRSRTGALVAVNDPLADERRRFEAFYRRKWQGHDGLWGERYPPDQVVYATTVYARRNAEILAAAGSAIDGALDLGCGVGDVSYQLASRAGRVTAIDVSLENAQRTRGNLRERAVSNSAVVQGGAERLPFADGSFGLVVLADVIEHVPDIVGCLTEVRRVLRPGGRVICVTPIRTTLLAWRTADWALRKLARPRGTEPLRGEHPDVFERFLSTGEMRDALRGAGLRPVRMRRVCFYPAPETAGAFGAFAGWIYRRVDTRRFGRLAAGTIGLFHALERLRFLNQKQLWVATR